MDEWHLPHISGYHSPIITDTLSYDTLNGTTKSTGLLNLSHLLFVQNIVHLKCMHHANKKETITQK